jgi:hypothetical protein
MPKRLWCNLLLHFFSYCNSFICSHIVIQRVSQLSLYFFMDVMFHNMVSEHICYPFWRKFLLHFVEKIIFSSSISCSLSHSYLFSNFLEKIKFSLFRFLALFDQFHYCFRSISQFHLILLWFSLQFCYQFGLI